MAKFLKQLAGVLTEESTIGTSAGAGDSGKVIHLDGAGLIDSSFLSPTIGVNTFDAEASEGLAAGDYVNIFNDAGTEKVQLADASDPDKEAMGFVKAAFIATATATVFFHDTNDDLSGLTPGVVQYLSESTPGGVTATAPSTAGEIVQRVGKSLSATKISSEFSNPITLVAAL